MDWHQYEAALFDLDGVITPTADVHMKAWSAMFNDFLSGVDGQDAYTDEDYFAHVDGKPRYDGVRDFLAHRRIELPEGEVSDSPDERTVCGLGNRKNVAFNEIIERDGVEPYPGTVGLLDDLTALGVRVAVVSSSKNARAVL